MKNLSAGRLAYLESDSLTECQCARIVRIDGETFGLTSAVEDISLNGVTYVADSGYTPTAVKANREVRQGTVDIEGLIQVLGISRADILDGLFDNARVYVFATSYESPVVDEQPLIAGEWGTIEIDEEGAFITEFRSLSEYLFQPVGRTIKASCDAVLGDSVCQVPLSVDDWQEATAYTATESDDASVGDIVKPTTQNGYWYKCTTAGTSEAGSPTTEPTWPTTIGATVTDGSVVWECIAPYSQTGTVTSVTNNRVFADESLIEQDDGWWDYGKLTWLTGNNAGLSMEVKTYAVAGSPLEGQISLFIAMNSTVQIGDTYTITAGCRKRFSTDCSTKFNNADNFQGFPHVPTQDVAGKFGGQ